MNDDLAEGDDNFEDWEDDEDEEIIVKSLFSNSNHNSMEKFMQHDKDNFGFDLREVVAASKFDDIRLIKLVNMIRRRVKDAGEHAIDPTFISNLKSDILRDDLLDDQDNMLPVLREDPVLFLLRDELVKNGIMADDDDDDDDVQAVEVGNEFVPGISDMKETLSRYQSLITSLTSSPDVADDSYYFDGYSNISIHETMLRDEPRTTSYADALVANCKFMKGKVVLDVGCGTGILCMLAVRAGARKVIGVDSSSIIERAQKVIDRNGMSDKITLVRGRLEEVKLPLEHDEVDVIVSEWMGYGLYFENMLSSVIYARDTYLSNNGILMPSDAKVYIEAMTAAGEVDRVAWWGNVYGFDMTDMADLLCCDAQVQLVENEDIISDRSLAHSLNMNQASDADLDFDAPFEMVISRDTDLRGFVISFDVIFAGSGFCKEVVLSTGVDAEPTHWKQTVLWLEPQNCAPVKAGDKVNGSLIYKRSTQNARDYSIKLTWMVEAKLASAASASSMSQCFKLAS